MKQIISIIALIGVGAFTAVNADSFAPWENAKRTGVRSVPDVSQHNIEIRSFYRSNNNAVESFRGETQADVQIVPWYTAERV